jgi:glycosyltransferase involved in cell wall biosynthesis
LEQRLLPRCYSKPKHTAYTTFSFLPSLRHRRINAIMKDILHLHWLGDGFLSPWSIGRLAAPVVWTMHDTWPFTGGCHWLKECKNYRHSCGRCPELLSARKLDLSHLHWRLKRRSVLRLKPTVVSPSRAYAALARQSGMLAGCRVEHIPNGIDTQVFRPRDKDVARGLLGLPHDRPLILFGAVEATHDHNKGFDLLITALHHLQTEKRTDVVCAVFGTSSDAIDEVPCSFRFLGQLRDELTLALAYSAADIFVCPSRQENLPNTIMESLACGTPVVAFAIGGIPDLAEHGVTGYLAAPHDPHALAEGIALLLDNPGLRENMAVASREKAERGFSMPVVVKRYLALYEEISAVSHGHTRR